MYNLYIAEKQKKLKEERLKIEKLENKLKENRKSKANKTLFYILRNAAESCKSIPSKGGKLCFRCNIILLYNFII